MRINKNIRTITYLLVLIITVATVFSGCGKTDSHISDNGDLGSDVLSNNTAGSDQKMSFDDIITAKTKSGDKLSMRTFSEYMYLDADYVKNNSSEGLIDRKYILYDPSISYMETTSELVFGIFVSDASEAIEEYGKEKFLDLYSVETKLEHSNLERLDDENHSGIQFRKLVYSDYASDGTIYTKYFWIGVKKNFFIMYMATEYNGSTSYVAYEDMADVAEAVMDSIIVK